MREQRKPPNHWTMLTWILLLVVFVLTLAATAMGPEPEEDGPVEYYARQQAGERYQEVLDRYGDLEGAAEAARLVYEMEMESTGRDGA